MRSDGHGPRRLFHEWLHSAHKYRNCGPQTTLLSTTENTRQTRRTFVARPFGPISAIEAQVPEKSYKLPTLRENLSLSSKSSRYNSQNTENGSAAGSKNGHHPAQLSERASTELQSRKKERKSKFAYYDQKQEHKLLVNRLLKDKGTTSYDWRKPLGLLLDKHFSLLNSLDLGESKCERVDPEVDGSGEVARVDSNKYCIRPIQKRHQYQCRLARDVPKPGVWSTFALVNYVENITRSQHCKDRLPEISQVHGKGLSNVADVVDALEEIFSSSTMASYLNIEVYNLALRFFYDHGLISKASSLFVQMEMSTIGPSTETYNIMLSGAARSRDLHNFSFILFKAIQRGFEPDGETWKMLLMACPSEEVKASIILYMWERGIIYQLPNNEGLRGLIVRTEMAFHIDKRGDRGDFLEHLDQRYGRMWTSRLTCNKLLHEFSKRYGLTKTLELLPGLKLRGFTPDEVSLSTLLRHCFLLKQHRNAIKTLQYFDDYFQFKPSKAAYETLFRMAWRDKLLYFARVVWKSARTHGQVTFKMRRLVSGGLLANTHDKAENLNEIPSRFILNDGKPYKCARAELDNIVGAGRHSSTIRSANSQLLNYFRDAGDVMEPTGLGELLLQALHFDLKRAAEKRSQGATLHQMLQDAVHFDVGALLIAREYITKTAQYYNHFQELPQMHNDTSVPRATSPLHRLDRGPVETSNVDNQTLLREKERQNQLLSCTQAIQEAGSSHPELEGAVNAQTLPSSPVTRGSAATKDSSPDTPVEEPPSAAQPAKKASFTTDEISADNHIPSMRPGAQVRQKLPSFPSGPTSSTPNGIREVIRKIPRGNPLSDHPVFKLPVGQDLLADGFASLPTVSRRGFRSMSYTPKLMQQHTVKTLSSSHPLSRQSSAALPAQRASPRVNTGDAASNDDGQQQRFGFKKTVLNIRKYVGKDPPRVTSAARPAKGASFPTSANKNPPMNNNQGEALVFRKKYFLTIPRHLKRNLPKARSAAPPAEAASSPINANESPSNNREPEPVFKKISSVSIRKHIVTATHPAEESPSPPNQRPRKTYRQRRRLVVKKRSLVTIRKISDIAVRRMPLAPNVIRKHSVKTKNHSFNRPIPRRQPSAARPVPQSSLHTSKRPWKSHKQRRRLIVRKTRPSLTLRKHIGHPSSKARMEEANRVRETARLHASLDQILNPTT